MKIAPDLDGLLLFFLLIFPGLVSMHVYRWFFPAKDIDWKTALIEALFYGVLNFGLSLPILIPIHRNNFYIDHVTLYVISMMVVIVVLPVAWPILLYFISKQKNWMQYIQLPFPTSWDYYFGKRRKCFVLVHLKNGKKIAGYFGSSSYATSFPRQGDLYLEKVIKVDKNGKFIGVISRSDGMIITSDVYDYIEIFK